jgi:cobalt/nickel transport system permease protein
VHLADGILESPTLLIGANAAGAALALLVARAGAKDDRRSAAFTGTLAAFVLAAQALNVPLVPGASAHVIGAGLLTVALGPGRAVLALLAVLLVQALLFADGGLTVLGINALNIAVLPVLAVHAIRRVLGPRRVALAAGIGTLLGNILGALGLGTLLWAGAGVPAHLSFGWLVAVQALAGLAEGTLTWLAIRHLATRMPSLSRAAPRAARTVPQRLDRLASAHWHVEQRRGLAWAAIAVGVALALLPLASATPDALARVLEQVRPSP